MKKEVLSSFCRWIISTWVLLFLLRCIELFLLYKTHSTIFLYDEAIGMSIDMLMLNVFLLILLPLYYAFSYISTKTSNLFIGTILSLYSIFHLAIIQYFVIFIKPLGGIIIGHSFNEVAFTIRTSETNYVIYVTCVILSILILLITWRLLKRIPFSRISTYIIFILLFLSIFLNVFLNNYLAKKELESLPYSLRINKSKYFYKSIFNILLDKKPNTENIIFPNRDTLFIDRKFISNEYPLLSETNFKDVLTPFFNKTSTKQPPNIVFIIVEGLGTRFMNNFHGLKLMPFLDSIAENSLYWNNTFTTSERSIGVIPSTLASAPYAEKGFTFSSHKIHHLSLINLLSKYNYYSSFFYGQPKWFHEKGPFLERNGINNIYDNYEFPKGYKKIIVGDYFWGYDDQDLVKFALQTIDTFTESPRMDIYYTGSMHDPYEISNPDYYNKRLDNLSKTVNFTKEQNNFVTKYRKYLRSILFTDDALQNLFAGYQQKESYKNTMFIITGDHPMAEIPIENALKRYRVPLIIYSPLLKKSKIFHSVNSHLDVAPTLLAFLNTNYKIELPKCNSFIGKTLDTCSYYRNMQPIAFMNDDRAIVDFLYKDYFLSNNKTLYKISQDLEMTKLEDTLTRNKLIQMLQNFRIINDYVSLYDKLIPDTIYHNYTNSIIYFKSLKKSYTMSKEQEYRCTVIEEMPITSSGRYYFDFLTYDNPKLKKDSPTLVLELYDANTNEKIFWQGFNFYEDKGNIHFSFNVQRKPSQSLVLKSYFWNNNTIDFTILKANCYLYKTRK